MNPISNIHNYPSISNLQEITIQYSTRDSSSGVTPRVGSRPAWVSSGSSASRQSSYGGFLKWGYPNSWMIYRENPIKMDDLGEPLFVETTILVSCHFLMIIIPNVEKMNYDDYSSKHRIIPIIVIKELLCFSFSLPPHHHDRNHNDRLFWWWWWWWWRRRRWWRRPNFTADNLAAQSSTIHEGTANLLGGSCHSASGAITRGLAGIVCPIRLCGW